MAEISGSTSDGYHTFDELYEHRHALWLVVCEGTVDQPVWRSTHHSDGSFFDGWFLLGIGKEPGKQITYHLPMILWRKAGFAETLDHAPEWDGHTAADTLKRLQSWVVPCGQ